MGTEVGVVCGAEREVEAGRERERKADADAKSAPRPPPDLASCPGSRLPAPGSPAPLASAGAGCYGMCGTAEPYRELA